jgi:hypothetical protein
LQGYPVLAKQRLEFGALPVVATDGSDQRFAIFLEQPFHRPEIGDPFGAPL